MPDPSMTVTIADGLRLLLVGGGAAALTQAYNTWRSNRRSDRLEPTKTVADAADKVAQSAAITVEALIAPLRAELAEVRQENSAMRKEIHSLRDALTAAGLPIPAPKLKAM